MERINIEKIVEEGRKIINSRYDMSSGQLRQLAETPDIVESISNAFCFGYLQGTKAAMAEMRKSGSMIRGANKVDCGGAV